MGRRPAGLAELIESLIVSLGQGRTFHGWRIVARWPEIVGPEIARISHAVRFANGVLTVVVEKDAWRQELEMQLEHILDKVRSLPEGRAVEKIVLRAGSHTEYEHERNDG